MNTAIKAKDLTKASPRSPRLRVGGYVILARMADKGRAVLAGTHGDYSFSCPTDNILFSFKGVTGADVRPLLESGATDEEIAAWMDRHGRPKTPAEIKSWSDATEAGSPYHDPKRREWFIGACVKLGLKPEITTLFDYLEADDRASFKKK